MGGNVGDPIHSRFLDRNGGSSSELSISFGAPDGRVGAMTSPNEMSRPDGFMRIGD
jgi:hypothetical protein